MDYEVVIAGGGFAGAYCARVLGCERGGPRAALIAERNVFVFQPMLAEVAGSSLGPLDVVNPLRQFCRGVDVLQGAITKIDLANKSLIFDGGRFTKNHTVNYKHLVVALGSVSDLSEIPGMAAHGRPMKDVADAIRLRASLINRLEEANLVDDPEIRSRLLTFVVVGGGYTGVETAGQLYDFLRQARRYYRHLQGAPVRMVLVHAHGQLLPEIGAKLGAYAKRVLSARGVEVLLNTRVAALSASEVTFSDGSKLGTNTVVTTIGTAPHPVVLDLCRQLGVEPVKGRLPVLATFQVGGQEGLWAAGDCAAVPWNDRGEQKIAPPTAQFAVREGKQLAKNLIRSLGNEELRPFQFRYLGQLATVGERHAVAEILGMHFSGFFAWWLWRTIYLAKLPGIARRLRVILDWTFDLIFRRDISVLIPTPRQNVKEPPPP